MAHSILMPMPGQMTEECRIVAWIKHEGDPIRKGDVLFEIETDKSIMEVEAFVEGTLLRIDVAEGITVPVNTVCAWVGAPDDVLPAPSGEPSALPSADPDPVIADQTAHEASGVHADSIAHASTRPAPAKALADPARGRRPSPRARRAASELGIDLASLTANSSAGRVTENDVRAMAGAKGSPRAEEASAGESLAIEPVADGEPGAGQAIDADDEEVRPLSRLRQTIAARLTQSTTTTPHFAVTIVVDMTPLLALRDDLRATESPLSITDFVARATTQTLSEFVDVNSRTDGHSVWVRRRVHLGLAVSVPGGLLVPVVRDSDRMTLRELHDAIAGSVTRARSGRLRADELGGGTFTITNMGMFGVDEFVAIINPGEAAILAVSSIVPTPAVLGEGIAIRQHMKLTISADHRLVDGEQAARFLNAIRRRLEDVTTTRRELLID
jgi:pyruvate dehydrogenase E2 component (dihydrolipoamide acetyltransferase)